MSSVPLFFLHQTCIQTIRQSFRILMTGFMYSQAELCKWDLMRYANAMPFDTDWFHTDCLCLTLSGLKRLSCVFTVWHTGNWQLISCWRAGKCTHICNSDSASYWPDVTFASFSGELRAEGSVEINSGQKSYRRGVYGCIHWMHLHNQYGDPNNPFHLEYLK